MGTAILSNPITGVMGNPEESPVAEGTLSDPTTGTMGLSLLSSGAPVIGNIGIVRAGETFTVTIPAGYSLSPSVVMNGTALITVETNATTLTATAPFGGFDGTNEWADFLGFGNNVGVRVTDSGGVSSEVEVPFNQPSNHSFITLSVDQGDVPDNSVFFGDSAGFIAGSQFTHLTLSDNTGEALVLDSEGVPQTEMSGQTHNFPDTYFLDVTSNFEASDLDALAVVIVAFEVQPESWGVANDFPDAAVSASGSVQASPWSVSNSFPSAVVGLSLQAEPWAVVNEFPDLELVQGIFKTNRIVIV